MSNVQFMLHHSRRARSTEIKLGQWRETPIEQEGRGTLSSPGGPRPAIPRHLRLTFDALSCI
jgi:hypothetical protein